jgi:hypothetical protein
VNAAPDTVGLSNQKLASLRGPELFLYKALHSERICDQPWGDEALVVAKSAVFNDYERRLKSRYPLIDGTLWKAMWAMLKGTSAKGYRPGGADRTPSVKLPPLAEARKAFERNLRAAIDWQDDAIEMDPVVKRKPARTAADNFNDQAGA